MNTASTVSTSSYTTAKTDLKYLSVFPRKCVHWIFFQAASSWMCGHCAEFLGHLVPRRSHLLLLTQVSCPSCLDLTIGAAFSLLLRLFYLLPVLQGSNPAMQYPLLYGTILPDWGLPAAPVQLAAVIGSLLEFSTHTYDSTDHVALGFCVLMLSDLC